MTKRSAAKKPVSHRAEGFPPVAAKNARVLILGSMPGIKSLEQAQYYAHPQNAFWHIMAALFDAPIDTYARKLALIRANGLALWDVLKYCERRGSLDMAIDDATIEVNDFAAFFGEQPRITHVFFNGAKAEAEFGKRVVPLLPDKVRSRLALHRLPSTSPAHAGTTRQSKLGSWRLVKAALES